jgi:hypothetical protein
LAFELLRVTQSENQVLLSRLVALSVSGSASRVAVVIFGGVGNNKVQQFAAFGGRMSFPLHSKATAVHGVSRLSRG